MIVVPHELRDFSGNIFAGTENKPVYFNSDGSQVPCQTPPNCFGRFKVTGYFIRKNLAGDPGPIHFAFFIEALRTHSGDPVFKSILVPIEVGLVWKKVDQVAIRATQYVYGIDANGNPLFRDFPTFLMSCGPNQFLAPDGKGGAICQSLPSVSAPMIPSSCPPNHFLQPNGSGGLVCQPLPLPRVFCRKVEGALYGAPVAYCQADEFVAGGGFNAQSEQDPFSCPGQSMPWPGNAFPHSFGLTNDGRGISGNFWGFGKNGVQGDTCGRVHAICCKLHW